MLEPAVDAGGTVDDDFDDIEWELSCSTREAGIGYVPFISPATAPRGPTPSDLTSVGRPWAVGTHA